MTTEVILMDACTVNNNSINNNNSSKRSMIENEKDSSNDAITHAVPVIKKCRHENEQKDEKETLMRVNTNNTNKKTCRQNKQFNMKRLKRNLKNEETKLILLKRLYYSQKFPPTQQQQQQSSSSTAAAPSSTIAPQAASNLNRSNQQHQFNKNKNLNHNRGTNGGGGSVGGGGGGGSNKNTLLGQYKSLHNNNRSHLNNNENDIHINDGNSDHDLDTKSNTHSNGDSNRLPLQNNNKQLNNRNSLDPAMLHLSANQHSLLARASPLPIQQQQQQQQQSQSQSSQHTKIQQSQPNQQQVTRKDFERAFSMIDFPKPAQSDCYFLPNTNNFEFVMCLGLEEVVKCVKDKSAYFNEELKYEYPYACTSCQTDYTNQWRKDKDGKVVCDKCLKTAEKKAIRHEHMSKLKQVFSKVFGKDKHQPQQQSSLNNQIHTNHTNVTAALPVATSRPTTHQQPQRVSNNGTPSGTTRTPQANSQKQHNNAKPSQTNGNNSRLNSAQSTPQNQQQQQQQQQQRGSNKKSTSNNNANNNPLAQFANFSQFNAAASTPAAQQLQLQQAAFLQRFLQQSNLSNFGQINSVAAAIAAAAGNNDISSLFNPSNWKP